MYLTTMFAPPAPTHLPLSHKKKNGWESARHRHRPTTVPQGGGAHSTRGEKSFSLVECNYVLTQSRTILGFRKRGGMHMKKGAPPPRSTPMYPRSTSTEHCTRSRSHPVPNTHVLLKFGSIRFFEGWRGRLGSRSISKPPVFL